MCVREKERNAYMCLAQAVSEPEREREVILTPRLSSCKLLVPDVNLIQI